LSSLRAVLETVGESLRRKNRTIARLRRHVEVLEAEKETAEQLGMKRLAGEESEFVKIPRWRECRHCRRHLREWDDYTGGYRPCRECD
jgi:hypothetical protein